MDTRVPSYRSVWACALTVLLYTLDAHLRGDMSQLQNRDLLDGLLDAWDRNNVITVNLLRAIPEDALEIRPMEGSPCATRSPAG